MRDLLNLAQEPVITGDFKPKFYWTMNPIEDAERINRPHIKKEGEQENRIQETIELLNELDGSDLFTIQDAFNIQKRLLDSNNWRSKKFGIRDHNVNLSTVDFRDVSELINQLFPVRSMNEKQLLEWYRQAQLIHPFSDLNGRVFGIIVSVLNRTYKKTKPMG
jgi:hypothetical protein